MFDINQMDFFGNKEFYEILDNLFSGARVERREDIPGVRIYIPRKGDTATERNKDVHPMPSWRKEVRVSEPVTKPVDFPKEPIKKAEPNSILEMLEDGDERLKRILGDIIDQKLAEREKAKEEPKPLKNDPSVFIANRLTFLIQTLQPIVFDTSSIETGKDFMTIALNQDKTFPKINTIDELGYITVQINNSPVVWDEIDSFLDEDGEYSSIYCFPTTMVNRDGDEVFAIKFVVYPKKA
jgi:hypothetical protein